MAEDAQAVETLSKREREVAAAYANGDSYKEIARDLGISPTTVRSHLRTVYGKLNVTSKIALAQALADPEASASEIANSDLTADLALELDEAMRRERMMSRVLRIISQKGSHLDDVLNEVLDQALEICEAEFGILMEHKGDYAFAEMHSRSISPAFSAWLAEQGVFHPGPETAVGRSARALSPVSISDVGGEGIDWSANPLRMATVEFGGARSLAAIPMTYGGRLIGVFSVYRTRVHPFNERSLELAQAFADQAAIAIENSRQIGEMEARLDQAKATREILQAISDSSDDEAPVFDAILRNARELCDAPFAALVLGRESDRHQTMIAHHGAVQSTEDIYAKGGVPMDPEKSFAARAIVEKRPVHLPNMKDTDEYRAGVPNVVDLCDNQGIRTNLFVPLIKDGEGIGCFIIFRHEVRPYSDDQIALVETLAAQAVIALENVRRFRELRARLDRAAATREILEMMSRVREDEQPIFEAILDNATRLCGAPNASLILGREGDDCQVMAANRGSTPETRAYYQSGAAPMNPEDSLVAQAIVEQRTIFVPDMRETEGFKAGHERYVMLVERQGIRTNLFVPLISSEGGVGCFILWKTEVAPFTPDQIALVETFAAQAAIALENVRQFKALEARTAEVQDLNASLAVKVEEQVDEIARIGRLKQFLSPAVADAFVSSGDEADLASHRALIATLFCDIRGFTAFCETAEPEETIEVLQAYHERMGELISAHGGGVDKRMGDGIMVIFNDPLPCDDPAGDAVRLALAMREEMRGLCARWRRLGHRLGFGVGISLGYATVGMVGSAGRFDYTASGTAVNTAARLCDIASNDEILLSPRAWTAVEGDFPAASRGEIEVKGIREPIEVFSVSA
ncbi:MAG: GAF domain-containing protein [Pseudomonadota bacterium]